MATVGSIVVNFFASTADYIKGLKKVESETAGTSKRMQGMFSKKSGVGQFAELLKGGGAVVGLTLLAREIDNITGKVIELNKKWKETSASMIERAVDVAEQMPILGSFVGVADKLESFISGGPSRSAIRAEMEQRAREQKAIDEEREQNRADGIKKLADLQMQFDDTLSKNTMERTAATLTGRQLEDYKLKFDHDTRLLALTREKLKLQEQFPLQFAELEDKYNQLAQLERDQFGTMQQITAEARKRADEEERTITAIERQREARDFERDFAAAVDREKQRAADAAEARRLEFNQRLNETPLAPVVERRTAFTVHTSPLTDPIKKTAEGVQKTVEVLQDISGKLDTQGVPIFDIGVGNA